VDAMADIANQAPIVRFVNLVLMQAVQDRASDIHFEPFETEFRIRYRVDGALYEMSPPPKPPGAAGDFAHQGHGEPEHFGAPAAAGRAHQLPDRNKSIDLRVSTLPTQFGESVVLRVLDRSAVNLEVESLGLPTFIYDYVTEAIQRPNGIFYCHGPDGCGKRPPCIRRCGA